MKREKAMTQKEFDKAVGPDGEWTANGTLTTRGTTRVQLVRKRSNRKPQVRLVAVIKP